MTKNPSEEIVVLTDSDIQYVREAMDHLAEYKVDNIYYDDDEFEGNDPDELSDDEFTIVQENLGMDLSEIAERVLKALEAYRRLTTRE